MNDQRMVDVELLLAIGASLSKVSAMIDEGHPTGAEACDESRSVLCKLAAIVDGPGVEPVAEVVIPNDTELPWCFGRNTKAKITPGFHKLYLAAPSAPVQAVPDWQSIETAPKDGTEIIAANARVAGGFMQVVAYDALYSAPWRTQEDYGYSERAFTHWMPRPQPPKESTAQSVACPNDKEK